MTLIRAARVEDAEDLVQLVALLGHDVDEDGVRRRVAELAENGIPQLVAVEDSRVVGLCGLHQMTAIHRDRPVGRVTILVVREAMRGSGTGRKLLEAAEEELRARGCGLIEITSNERLNDAHRFYEHLGYERTSFRFMKRLDPSL